MPEAAPLEERSSHVAKYWAAKLILPGLAVGSGRSCTAVSVRPAADGGKANALPHLGDLHCGARRRMIRHKQRPMGASLNRWSRNSSIWTIGGRDGLHCLAYSSSTRFSALARNMFGSVGGLRWGPLLPLDL